MTFLYLLLHWPCLCGVSVVASRTPPSTTPHALSLMLKHCGACPLYASWASSCNDYYHPPATCFTFSHHTACVTVIGRRWPLSHPAPLAASMCTFLKAQKLWRRGEEEEAWEEGGGPLKPGRRRKAGRPCCLFIPWQASLQHSLLLARHYASLPLCPLLGGRQYVTALACLTDRLSRGREGRRKVSLKCIFCGGRTFSTCRVV